MEMAILKKLVRFYESPDMSNLSNIESGTKAKNYVFGSISF